MTLCKIVSSVCCHIYLLAHERVPQREIEGIAELCFIWPDLVEETFRVLRGLEGLKSHGVRLLTNFVESYKGCTSQAMLT